MAIYKGTMSVDGNGPYSNTAGGYQIGGADIGSAWCTITLPDTYSAYNVCSLTCALYSRTAPSNWLSTWTCDIKITIKGQTGTWRNVTKDGFDNGGGSTSRRFEIDLDQIGLGTLSLVPGDYIKLEFVGHAGTFVDDNDRCVYLRSATLISNDAIEVNNYLKVASSGRILYVADSYQPVSVTSSTSGTFFMKFADYKKYFGFAWGAGEYVQVTLPEYYVAGVTYYKPSLAPLLKAD